MLLFPPSSLLPKKVLHSNWTFKKKNSLLFKLYKIAKIVQQKLNSRNLANEFEWIVWYGNQVR